MKYILVLSIINLIVFGCSMSQFSPKHANVDQNTRQLLRNTLAEVHIEDGIDQQEATRIADAYLIYYSDIGCGGLGIPVDAHSSWLIPVAIGFAAERVEDIIINKESAIVSWARGPTVSTKDMIDELND